MSIVASLKVVPASLFKKHKKSLEEIVLPKDAPSFDIDKAWQELHAAFKLAGEPLAYAIKGDFPVDADWNPPLDEVDELYMAFVSPPLVKRVAKALASVTQPKLNAMIQKAGWSLAAGDKKYCWLHFRSLRKAYHRAAKENAALEVFMT